MRHRDFLSALLLIHLTSTAAEPGKKLETESTESHVVRPAKREFSEERMKQLKLAPGFQINVFAKGIENARMMAVAEDGTVFVTQPAKGQVTALRDKDGDGVAEENNVAVPDVKDVHGITLHDNYLFLASTKQLLRASMQNGKPGKPEILIKDLPDGGQHPRRTIGFGPDKKLYLSIGSTCNNCEESNPEHATMLVVDPSNWQRKVFAKGLRNTIGFAWHPQTKEFWGMDHGSDDRGNDIPPEELNLIQSADYGWPFCYGQKTVDKKANDPQSGGTKEEHCSKSVAPVLEYQAHSSPIGLAFYTGSQFPEEFKNDAFVAMRGSWNRNPPTGYKIVRIDFENGKPLKFHDFVRGFLIEDGKAHFGRLAGVAVAKDGGLLFSDDANGMIYHVAYLGAGKETKP